MQATSRTVRLLPLPTVVALLLSLAPGTVRAQPSGSQGDLDAVRALVANFVSLEQAFDPRLADLYADDAVIRNRRVYPTGEVRELTFPAPQYKELVRKSLPLARARGDRSIYSRCRYAAEAPGVRVSCQRFSQLKKYASPISLLVVPAASGQWRIQEELSESRP